MIPICIRDSCPTTFFSLDLLNTIMAMNFLSYSYKTKNISIKYNLFKFLIYNKYTSKLGGGNWAVRNLSPLYIAIFCSSAVGARP
jgi:hypothetical protein